MTAIDRFTRDDVSREFGDNARAIWIDAECAGLIDADGTIDAATAYDMDIELHDLQAMEFAHEVRARFPALHVDDGDGERVCEIYDPRFADNLASRDLALALQFAHDRGFIARQYCDDTAVLEVFHSDW